jgi:hypothetical protein
MSKEELPEKIREITFAIGDLTLVLDHISEAVPVLLRKKYFASAESLMNIVPLVTTAIRNLANEAWDMAKEAEKHD